MKIIFRILLLVICLILIGFSVGIFILFDQFGYIELLKLELELSFDIMYVKVDINEEYLAIFCYQDVYGKWVELFSEICVCGCYCCWVCDFLLLRIDFFKSDFRVCGLVEYDDMKLVIYCQIGKKGKEVVLWEYFVYKMYQELFDYVFWV